MPNLAVMLTLGLSAMKQDLRAVDVLLEESNVPDTDDRDIDLLHLIQRLMLGDARNKGGRRRLRCQMTVKSFL
jgi:hypothetical protein